MPENFPRKALSKLKSLLRQARHTGLIEPAAMTLATSSRAGAVTSRTVLLKGVSPQGLVFYTNLQSRKGRQIKFNPLASACFYWDPLHWQVIVDGRMEPVTQKEADHYWATRDRGKQLAAWASLQSSPLRNMAVLRRRFDHYKKLFSGKPIPRPPHWTGLCLRPNRIEFWKRGENRLHSRLIYERKGKRWKAGQLFP